MLSGPDVDRAPGLLLTLQLSTPPTYGLHHWLIDGQLETLSSPHRYLWPSELDLMAKIAGMTLRERWSSWNRDPFTSDSTMHISVWQKSA